jgi:hypothetical protein
MNDFNDFGLDLAVIGTDSMAGLILTAMRLPQSWEDHHWRG